jgi:pyridinium-3,5-biscarboxylic acid mononucleotide sulfurtransferase
MEVPDRGQPISCARVSSIVEQSLESKLEQARAALRAAGSVLVCFSGGIDSALVLQLAWEELGERAVGLTAVSPSLPARELEGAESFARSLGVRHLVVRSNELARPGYVANGPDRCFHCKSELYEMAARTAQDLGLSRIANGTNRDDHGDYRPGLEAAKNAEVHAPLAEAGFTKADVRAAAELLGIPLFAKPAAACLASRLPYGTQVTRERLAQVEGFEAALQDLGFAQVRVRHHETIARIEVPLTDLARLAVPEVAAQAIEIGRRYGFQYVTLDLGGYRTGSHNELLTSRTPGGRTLRVLQG